jgi:hypothetical protein
MLEEANNLHPNIKLVRRLGTSVSFFDVFIGNKNGVLETAVYRKEVAEPYIVPFKSDHPHHVFANIIDGALILAMRYSSKLPAFNEERRSIKLMFVTPLVHSLCSIFYLSSLNFTDCLRTKCYHLLFITVRSLSSMMTICW